jgi:phage gp36-like protein
MTYCTKPDLISAFGEEEIISLTDRAANAVVNDAVLNAAIADADAQINIWLQGSYSLPLPTVPAVLTRIACNVTRYLLWGDIAEDHPAARRYAEDIRTLRAIARGEASLGLTAAGESTARVDLVQVSSGRNDFSDRSTW